MANIAVTTAGKIEVVQSFEQLTLPAAETIVAGAPVRIDTSAGTFTNANATTAAEARVYGIALKSVIAGQAVTAVRHGILDGFAFGAGTDYDENVWLSDTDGRIADEAGTVSTPLGRCVPGTSPVLGTAYDKLFLVEVIQAAASAVDALAVAGAATAGTMAVDDADGLTVNDVIVPQAIEVVFHAQPATDMVDQSFFIANRAYTVTIIKFVHAVAETTAATLLVQVTKDTGTQAPGAGANLLTNNTNTGFDCKATANTVQAGTLTATGADLALAAGNRLSVDFTAAATELVGVTISVTLIPV